LPDRIGCASCYDGLDEFIEVKFSDHSKKSVTFPLGSAPKEINALSEKLLSLEAKLRNELPIQVTKSGG
jgi:protein-arginine kinase activator protein McsA